MDDAAHFAAVFRLHRHHKPPVADGHNGVLQHPARLLRFGESIQLVADGIFRAAYSAPDIIQRIAGGIRHFRGRHNGLPDGLFQRRLRRHGIKVVVDTQGIVLGDMVPRGQLPEIAQGARKLQKLGHREHAALACAVYHIFYILHPGKPRRAVFYEQGRHGIRLGQLIAHSLRGGAGLLFQQQTARLRAHDALRGARKYLIEFQRS